MKIAKQPEGRLEKIGPVFHISLRASWSPKCRKSFSEPYSRHIGNTCLSFSIVLMGTICSMWSMFLPHSLQWLFGSGYIYILDFIGTFVYFSHAWMQHLLTWNPQKKRISFGFGWWFRWFYDLFFDNFIPCLFCGLKLQHVKATPPFAALNSSTVDCLGPHWWRLGRSARQPRVSKWFHLNIIIVYIYIYT